MKSCLQTVICDTSYMFSKHRMGRCVENVIAQERMWRDEIMVFFKVLFRHLPGQTRKNQEKLGINGNSAEIQIRLLLNTSLQCYLCTNFSVCIC
jgi:hypothetical protein